MIATDNRSGDGDYTADRAAWLDGLTIDQVMESIEPRRKPATQEPLIERQMHRSLTVAVR